MVLSIFFFLSSYTTCFQEFHWSVINLKLFETWFLLSKGCLRPIFLLKNRYLGQLVLVFYFLLSPDCKRKRQKWSLNLFSLYGICYSTFFFSCTTFKYVYLSTEGKLQLFSSFLGHPCYLSFVLLLSSWCRSCALYIALSLLSISATCWTGTIFIIAT